MAIEWQDEKLLKLLADEGPLDAYEKSGPNGLFFEFNYNKFQGGEGFEPVCYEASRVHRLAEDGLLLLHPMSSTKFKKFNVEITQEGRAVGGR